MKFRKVLNGYDPKEVDRHLTDTANKEQQIRTAQKERIDQLVEENTVLRSTLEQLQQNEQAISKSLIDCHNVAEQVRSEAEQYSESVVKRAKIFCASWRAYAQTLVASLTDEEVVEFSFLQRKIENLVKSYESGKFQPNVAATATFDEFSNPISRIEGAEEPIDIQELLNPKQSLEEICAELGLLKAKQ